MVNTPSQTDVYSTALDIFDRTHPLRVDVDENLKVAGVVTTVPSGTQNVSVTSSVLPAGAATQATLAILNTNIALTYGTFNYYAGTSGTIVVGAGQRVLSLSCHSTSGGTLSINGGASIPIPANVGFDINLLGNLTAPTIVYTGTDSYFVQVVS